MGFRCVAVLLMAGGWTTLAAAGPVVVADSACPRHAVDIEAFATCEGDRVAKPEEEATTDGRSLSEPAPTDYAQAVEVQAPARDSVLPNS